MLNREKIWHQLCKAKINCLKPPFRPSWRITLWQIIWPQEAFLRQLTPSSPSIHKIDRKRILPRTSLRNHTESNFLTNNNIQHLTPTLSLLIETETEVQATRAKVSPLTLTELLSIYKPIRLKAQVPLLSKRLYQIRSIQENQVKV